MRPLTKEAREASRDAQFARHLELGGIRHDFPGLVAFTWVDSSGAFCLRYWIGNACNAADFLRFRSESDRDARLITVSENVARNRAYKAELRERYKGQKSSHAAAAASVRSELRAEFPGVKFSVTCDSYAGGDSVKISWIDGPAVEQVVKISGKYQYGHFNGMEDIYEYTNKREDVPQVKYVFESREMSAETEQVLMSEFSKVFPGEDWEIERQITENARRCFNETSLPVGAVVTGIVRDNDALNGFKLAFSAPKQTQATPSPSPVVVPPGKIQVIEYSQRALAVIGDTKSCKDVLKSLGGSFNPRLSCGPGWIFPKGKLEAIKGDLSSFVGASIVSA